MEKLNISQYYKGIELAIIEKESTQTTRNLAEGADFIHGTNNSQ